MRTVLITGGSDGIGRAIARRLASDGDTRVTLVSRNPDRLRKAAASLSGSGHDFMLADLGTSDGARTVAHRLAASHFDVLVNNAGAGLYGRFEEMSLDEQLRMMRLNLDSVVMLSHAYLHSARPGDALVNTASFLAYAPLPGAAVYSASKAFVATLSEALWWEYRRKDVYVVGLCPAVITTGFHSTAGGSAATFPRFLVQSPDAVAEELVSALRARSAPRLITGHARTFVRALRFVPRRTAIHLMGTRGPL